MNKFNAEQLVEYQIAGGWSLEEISAHASEYFYNSIEEIEAEGGMIECSEEAFKAELRNRYSLENPE